MGRAELWLELMKLTADERLELVQDLWDSIGSEALAPLTDEEKEELERRLEEHRRDPSTAITWEELKADLLSRLK
jgi:putative addiction module component (TIGR02574 family)